MIQTGGVETPPYNYYNNVMVTIHDYFMLGIAAKV